VRLRVARIEFPFYAVHVDFVLEAIQDQPEARGPLLVS